MQSSPVSICGGGKRRQGLAGIRITDRRHLGARIFIATVRDTHHGFLHLPATADVTLIEVTLARARYAVTAIMNQTCSLGFQARRGWRNRRIVIRTEPTGAVPARPHHPAIAGGIKRITAAPSTAEHLIQLIYLPIRLILPAGGFIPLQVALKGLLRDRFDRADAGFPRRCTVILTLLQLGMAAAHAGQPAGCQRGMIGRLRRILWHAGTATQRNQSQQHCACRCEALKSVFAVVHAFATMSEAPKSRHRNTRARVDETRTDSTKPSDAPQCTSLAQDIRPRAAPDPRHDRR